MAVNGKILAERVAFPIVRHHDPSQMRMITKANAEQIERLTLIPVGAVPYSVTESISGLSPCSLALSRSRSPRRSIEWRK